MTIYQRPWGSLACHWGKDPMTEVVIRATLYLPVSGFEPTTSEFLDKCATS